jgi:hypothetical protein
MNLSEFWKARNWHPQIKRSGYTKIEFIGDLMDLQAIWTFFSLPKYAERGLRTGFLIGLGFDLG